MLIRSAGFAPPQSVDDAIERHLDALGGRAALARITSRASIGRVTIASAAGEVTGSIESYAQVPNKSRTVMRLDLSPRGLGEMTIDQRFDGTTGVVINSLQGTTDITGDQLEDMRSGTFPSTLMTYKQQGLRADLLPPGSVDGKDAIVISLKPRRGPAVRMFFDADTHLLVRTVATVVAAQVGTMDVRTDFSDYRRVGDVLVAFHTVTSSSLQTVTIAFTDIRDNVPVDDAMFLKK